MRARILLVVFVALFAVACSDSSPDPATTTGPQAARWELDEEANLAVPVCAGCGELAERPGGTCAQCGAEYVVEAKEIPCPECAGNAACVHCGDAAVCVACEGSGHCAICEGSGTFEGEGCPECEGGKACTECSSKTARACERCDNTGKCANCDASGTITLR